MYLLISYILFRSCTFPLAEPANEAVETEELESVRINLSDVVSQGKRTKSEKDKIRQKVH